jgi:hypothetical protein
VVEGGRIAQEIAITLPARTARVRYAAEFGRYCEQVREALHLEAAPA